MGLGTLAHLVKVLGKSPLRVRRLVAGGIDLAMAAMIGVAALRLLDLAPDGFPYLREDLRARELAAVFSIFLAWLAYRTLAEASGQGLGKWIADLELRAADGSAPGVAKSLLRAFTAPIDALLSIRGRRRFDPAMGVTLDRAEHIDDERTWRIVRQLPWVIAGVAALAICWRTPDEVLLHDYRRADAEYSCCDLPSQWHCYFPVRGMLELRRRGHVSAAEVLDRCPNIRALAGESR